MTSEKLKIGGLGELLWDIYADKKYPGGAPANFAFHVCQYGHTGYILSRVGNDVLGEEIKSVFAAKNINLDYIQKDMNLATGTVKVTLDNQGVPSFECSKHVAFDNLQFSPDWQQLSGELDAVLWGTLAQREESSRTAIQSLLNATSAVKIFDVNVRGWNEAVKNIINHSLKLADIIKLNDDELFLLKTAFKGPQDNLEFLHSLITEFHINLAAVTLGAKGCMLVTKDKVVTHPGFKVKALDTTGSGDAFAAGLTIKYLEGASLEEMAEFGNRLGAFNATKQGATPGWKYADLFTF